MTDDNMTPLFGEGARVDVARLEAALEGPLFTLVRTYPALNTATTTAAKYNARHGHIGTFYVRRVATDRYGVFVSTGERHG